MDGGRGQFFSGIAGGQGNIEKRFGTGLTGCPLTEVVEQP